MITTSFSMIDHKDCILFYDLIRLDIYKLVYCCKLTHSLSLLRSNIRIENNNDKSMNVVATKSE